MGATAWLTELPAFRPDAGWILPTQADGSV